MVVLRAIGGFFARIGRWIKETAWIQPLLIVGAIFAVIFSIPHIIKGVSSWFDESDSANKFLTRYRLDLKDANVVPDGKYVGKSKVDEFLTYVEDGETEKIKTTYGERFFVAFVKDDSSSKDLYGGLKTFKDKWAAKDQEFVGINKDLLKGDFRLHTIYVDSTTTVDGEEINLFDEVWTNHYTLFETMATSNYLETTYYAMNHSYKVSDYEKAFTSTNLDACPMNTPLVMYFDFSADNPLKDNQKVAGLSDVIFTVEGTSDLERARTLKNCWAHTEKFGKLLKN